MLYLKNAELLNWKTLAVRKGHLAVEPGTRGKARFVSRVPKGAKALDCSGKLVTKAFAVGHHHVYSALARGMPAPPRAPKNFVDILKLIWWRLDKSLDREMIQASALSTAVEAAKSGATFVIDHHASPNAATASLHLIAEAFDMVGVSHLLCYELSDRDGAERRQRGLEETDRYLETRQGLVGLHASFTVGDELLRRAAAVAERHDTGFHVHVAEAASDEEHCRKRYGKRVLERFSERGVLDSPKTILAHGIHLNDRERGIFRKSRAWLVQNAESNLNNGVGLFDGRGLGDRIMLGTDGMHSDMIASTKAAFLTGGGLSPAGAYARLRRVHDYLASNGFEGDGENNLVVLDYKTPTPVSKANWPGHFCYGLSRSHVHSVISDGRLIVRAGRVTTVDEDKVYEYSRKQAERLWRKLRRRN
jgi:cytosine/adenosine deaminase-related metal-dependent hydrolase